MTSGNRPAQATKDAGQLRQKQLLADYFARLANAGRDGRKCVYTLVPGNLNELLLSFDVLPILPELNALQAGLRGKSGEYIRRAEQLGHSEDVCAYVKCDLGMLSAGHLGPHDQRLPRPDLLLLSYTGCFTYVKWFELLHKEIGCPLVTLHVPFQEGGRITEAMRTYVVEQLRSRVIPALEEITGRRYDESRLEALLAQSAKAEEDFVWVFDSARHVPSPIDALFGGVYYMGPLFTAYRGTPEAVEYYGELRREVAERIRLGQGPMAAAGPSPTERFRIVLDGPPNWPSFRELWKMFADEGAVVVAATYTKVGGLYDRGFRHDPSRPLESLAEHCLGCYTNLSVPERIALVADYVERYRADGVLINSVKSCHSFSVGQPLLLRELEKRTGVPGGFLEGDLVDPRCYSAANVKTRLDSFFQMIDERRAGKCRT